MFSEYSSIFYVNSNTVVFCFVLGWKKIVDTNINTLLTNFFLFYYLKKTLKQKAKHTMFMCANAKHWHSPGIVYFEVF